jgi:hypothetical protein
MGTVSGSESPTCGRLGKPSGYGLPVAPRHLLFLFLWLSLSYTLLPVNLAAQQPQNPSPMVEHTRTHPRLTETQPPGRHEKLDLGTLYLPNGWKPRSGAPLLIFFHGGVSIPEVAAAKEHLAAISVQAGEGSSVYARLFDDPARFGRLLREAEDKAGCHFGPVLLGSWSAGYGAIREILKTPGWYARVGAVLLIDSMHAGYIGDRPGPLESKLDPANLEVWIKFGRDAVAGHKRFVVTHSEIFPGTFASTTETADYLLAQLGMTRRPVLRWGPMGLQQLSEAKAGRFLLLGYAGNSAPDHVDQLQSLPMFLKLLLR